MQILREKNGELPTGLLSNNIILETNNYMTNLTIEHNNFLHRGSVFTIGVTRIIANKCSLVNNIFEWDTYGRYVADFCSFRNNFGFINNGTFSNNFGSGNFTDGNLTFDLLFVNYTNVNNSIITYNFDLHIVDGSPLLTAANDGGQLGIYGGRFPWKDGSIPFNPHIVTKNISGSTDTNGNIPVNIEVEAQQN